MNMRHQSRRLDQIGRCTLIACVLAWWAPAAYASVSVDNPIPSITITCGTCNSLATLQNAALAYFNEWDEKDPPGFPLNGLGEYGNGYFVVVGSGQAAPLGQTIPNGTIIMVISTEYAIAANFEFGYNKTLRAWQAIPLAASSDAATRALDNILNARAAEVPPINIPSTYSYTDTPEIISAYVQTQLISLGPFETNLWHNLEAYGQYVEYEVKDIQTGDDYWIYVNDAITFKFSNGYTEKWQYNGPYPSVQWQPVSGTLRDQNGNVPGQSPPSGAVMSGAGASYAWDPSAPAFNIEPFMFGWDTFSYDGESGGTVTADWGAAGIFFCTDTCD